MLPRYRLGSVLSHRGKFVESEGLLSAVHRYRLATDGEDSLEVARIRASLASVYYNLSRRDEAEKVLLQALETRRARKDFDTTEVVDCLLLASFLYWEKRDYAQALEYGEEAKSIAERNDRKDTMEYFRVQLTLGRVHQSKHPRAPWPPTSSQNCRPPSARATRSSASWARACMGLSSRTRCASTRTTTSGR